VPEVGDGQEREIEKTVAALDKAAEEIAALAPETIIFISPHSTVYDDYFHISPGRGAKGDLVRFRAPETRFITDYDTALVDAIAAVAEREGIAAGTLGEREVALDHGTTVPMWFINQRWLIYHTVRISPSGMDAVTHYRFGQCIAEAVEETKRRVVLIASGDLSHKLSNSGPYGFSPAGAKFDAMIGEVFQKGDFYALLNIPGNIREQAAECGYNPCVILAGCFDKQSVESELYSYEGPFGVGYAIASVTAAGIDESRDFARQFRELLVREAQEQRQSEDAYRSLARRSLEYTLHNKKTLPLPDDLPAELLEERAGVFVTIYKYGNLRGCIGTIAPTKENIALEIINNAISSGLHDYRFEPVTLAELDYLTYKVDVLGKPEPIAGMEELDVKRFGVIVTSGHKRGLLLPNLEGIDTVEEQVAIARQKGGIRAGEEISLERFEVVRHE
jgi:AmmeMemoRadiSam system protein A